MVAIQEPQALYQTGYSSFGGGGILIGVAVFTDNDYEVVTALKILKRINLLRF